MSTDLITYLNYVSTWDTESDENIDKLLDEHRLFVDLGDFDSDTALNEEFGTLNSMAMQLRDETIAADAIQMAADAAAVASIWSFGLGMAAFAVLEATHAIEEAFISKLSDELNAKLATVDTDISSKISPIVNSYVVQYKANNNLIASKAPKGLDTRTCRALLLQFMAEVQKQKGKLDAATFKMYAKSARVAYNSPEIDAVYDAFDKMNLSEKTDQDIQEFLGTIVGFTGFNTQAVSLIQGAAITLMFYKLNIADTTIKTAAEAAGFELSEVEYSRFGMLDAVGKFIAVVAVIMSVFDTVLDILDIINVVDQCRTMCDKLNGPIRDSYKSFFDGLKSASKAYKAAITPTTPSDPPIGPAPPVIPPSSTTVDFQLPLNLNQALELSLNVPGTSNVPSLLANLTTNSNQWEPGEFSNGVWAWSPNVFALHNFGANQGSAQRFAYIVVASQAPYTLKQLQIQIGTNAQGSSAANPVIVAVEMSPRNDFVGYSTLGTVKSHQTGPQSLTMSQSIPTGMQYIRLRATSQVPDGSNYIVYSNISLAGSAQTIPAGSIPAINTNGRTPVATGASFTLSYNLKQASDNALLVGVTGPAQTELFSLLGTNALQWEPGEFNNGVTSFGTDKVFILHNSGTVVGANQRYPYIVIATQHPLVVGSVTANLTSNAVGTSPSNPVAIAIEASTSPNFQGAVKLGVVSTVAPTCVASTLLPKGVSYIRFRSTTQIPDSSNYIAFSNISIICTKVQDS